MTPSPEQRSRRTSPTLHKRTRMGVIWLSATLLFCWIAPLYAEPQPYSARYSMYRNGKLIGKSDVILILEGEEWTLKSDSRGTHGLAKLLRFRDDEHVSGKIVNGQFRPDRYTHTMRVAGMDQNWAADFNWQEETVHVIVDDDEEYELTLSRGALDPLSLKLEMRRQLDSDQEQLQFHMVEEDEIGPQNFRRLDSVRMETSLGCLDTVPLEKVRRPSSTRYTRAWHAPALGNIEVRMEHGKTDGDHYELRITELKLDGERVEPSPGCSGGNTGQ